MRSSAIPVATLGLVHAYGISVCSTRQCLRDRLFWQRNDRFGGNYSLSVSQEPQSCASFICFTCLFRWG